MIFRSASVNLMIICRPSVLAELPPCNVNISKAASDTFSEALNVMSSTDCNVSDGKVRESLSTTSSNMRKS